eukprot:3518743-Pleurochrysis_carterae.AAC.1
MDEAEPPVLKLRDERAPLEIGSDANWRVPAVLRTAIAPVCGMKLPSATSVEKVRFVHAPLRGECIPNPEIDAVRPTASSAMSLPKSSPPTEPKSSCDTGT